MRGIQLCTGKYAAECAQWLRDTPGFHIAAEERDGPRYQARVFFEPEEAGLLLDFFQRLLLAQNPLYSQSEKLRRAAGEVLRGRDRERGVRALERFLDESDTLNVEGYIQFRMYEQGCALNLLLYSLAKKLRQK